MEDNKKIGDYRLCDWCRAVISTREVQCDKCCKESVERLRRFFRIDDGIDRAIERLNEKEKTNKKRTV